MCTNLKRILYVGGLEEVVTESILAAAFVPFGNVVGVQIPVDNESGKSRGFGFVEFDSTEDVAEAIDNMHEAEMLGRTITVSYAKPFKIKEGAFRPIWADDDWLVKYAGKGIDNDLMDLDDEEAEVLDNDDVSDDMKEKNNDRDLTEKELEELVQEN